MRLTLAAARRAGLSVLLMAEACKPGCDHPRAGPQAAPGLPSAARRSCDSGDWTTYGRDPRRTSASPGCCVSPLRELWRFAPEPRAGRTAAIQHAIATSDAIYASAIVGDSPAVYRISLAGDPVWVYDSRLDIAHSHWPSWGHGHVILNDDGLFILDPRTGTKLFDRGLDSWGQTLADATRLYVVNEWHVAGPRVLVGAFDPEGNSIWHQNVSGAVREDVRDVVGAIALDGGTLFQAADHRYIPLSGLFAFDAATGARRWVADVQPASAVSAGHGNVYMVERASRDQPESLTARSQQTGEVVWSSPVQRADEHAPVLVSNLVLIYSQDQGLGAWEAQTGRPVWTQWVGEDRRASSDHGTRIAAASGSETLVFTSGAAIAVFSVTDGRELWRSANAVDAGARWLHSPVIAHGRVYVVASGALTAMECGPTPP